MGLRMKPINAFNLQPETPPRHVEYRETASEPIGSFRSYQKRVGRRRFGQSDELMRWRHILEKNGCRCCEIGMV